MCCATPHGPLYSKKWRAAVNRHVELLSGIGSKLAVPETAMVTAAKEELLNDGRRRERWLIAAQARPMPPIAKQNDAIRVLHRTWTPAAKEAVRSARKAVKREMDAAKATWVRETIGTTHPQATGDRLL